MVSTAERPLLLQCAIKNPDNILAVMDVKNLIYMPAGYYNVDKVNSGLLVSMCFGVELHF